MKRFLLLLSVVCIVVVLAALATVAYLYLQWPADKVLRQVNDFLAREYGVRVEITSAQLNWLKGISLKDPKLVEKNGIVLLEAKEIIAQYDVLALLQKTIKFSRLSILGLYTTQEHIENIIARFQKTHSSQKNNTSFQLLIHQMMFVDSQILYNKIPINVNITWHLKTFQKPATYNGSLESFYGKVSFHGKGNTIRFQVENMEVSRFFPTIKDILLQTMRGELLLQKNLWAFRGNSLSLLWQSNKISSSKYMVTYDTRKQEVFLTDTHLMLNKSEIVFSNLFYSLTKKIAYGEAKSFDIQLGDFLPEADGELKGNICFHYEDGEISRLDGKLVLEGISYGPLRGKGEFVIHGLTLDGETSVSLGKNTFFLRSSPIGQRGLAISLTTEEFDLADLFRQKWPPKVSSTGSSTAASKQPFSLEKIVDLFPLAIDVSIPRVVYDKLTLENFRFKMLPRSSFWAIEDIGCDVLRGSIEGRATLAGDFIRGQLSIREIRLHDLNQNVLKDGKSLYGTLRGNIQYQLPLGNLTHGYALFSFVVERPEFRNFVLQHQVSELLYNLPLERLSFDSFVINGEMREGVLSLKEITLDSYDIQATMPAFLVLSNQQLHAEIVLSLSKDYVSGLPNVTQLLTTGYVQGNKLLFRLRITNTLFKPKVILLPAGG